MTSPPQRIRRPADHRPESPPPGRAPAPAAAHRQTIRLRRTPQAPPSGWPSRGRAAATGRKVGRPGCGNPVAPARRTPPPGTVPWIAPDHRPATDRPATGEAASGHAAIAARAASPPTRGSGCEKKEAPPLPFHCHAGQVRCGSTPPSAPREVARLRHATGRRAGPRQAQSQGCACRQNRRMGQVWETARRKAGAPFPKPALHPHHRSGPLAPRLPQPGPARLHASGVEPPRRPACAAPVSNRLASHKGAHHDNHPHQPEPHQVQRATSDQGRL